jgi:hypothetical protein
LINNSFKTSFGSPKNLRNLVAQILNQMQRSENVSKFGQHHLEAHNLAEENISNVRRLPDHSTQGLQ